MARIRARKGTGSAWRCSRHPVRLGVGILACAAGLAGTARGARAAEPAKPSVTLRPDGSVEARLTVAASEESVRNVLRDPEVGARLTRDVISVESEIRGRCSRVSTKTRGLLRPLTYTSLRCPTPQGWTESLLESKDFSLYEAEWRLTPRPGGTEIFYRLRLQVSIPAPESLVHYTMKQSVRDALIALQLSLTR